MALTATPAVRATNRAIHATGQLYTDGNLAVDGASELDGNVDINGTLAVDGAVTLTGAVTAPGGFDSTGRLTTTDGVASGTAKVVGGRSYSMTAAGTAHTNSTTETVLGSFSIPANTIKAGTVVKIRYQGIASTTTGATTLTVVLKIGPTTLTGQAIITHSATDAADNDIFTGYAELVGRAAPAASAACVVVTQYNAIGAAGGALLAGFLGSTNFATNGALLVEVTADWSAADANSCRLDILNVEIL